MTTSIYSFWKWRGNGLVRADADDVKVCRHCGVVIPSSAADVEQHAEGCAWAEIRTLRQELQARMVERENALNEAAYAKANENTAWVHTIGAFVEAQRKFSLETFGPGPRTKGIIDHIKKELAEIEADPGDVKEWIDVVILALDGAWRVGARPKDVDDGIWAKLRKNQARTWPRWQDTDPDAAIEHDRTGEAAPVPAGELARRQARDACEWCARTPCECVTKRGPMPANDLEELQARKDGPVIDWNATDPPAVADTVDAMLATIKEWPRDG